MDGKEDGRPACPRCNDILPNKLELETHMLVCIRPQKGVTFTHMWKAAPSVGPLTFSSNESDGIKFLPPSQELVPISEEATQNPQPQKQNDVHECIPCGKSFTSLRGLNQHKRSRGCKTNTAGQDPVIQVPQIDIQNTCNPIQTEEPPRVAVRTTAQNNANIWGVCNKEDLTQIMNAAYEEIVFWRKNIFKLPSGAAGKNYVREMTRLIQIFTGENNPISDIALKAVMLMPALLMQKPSRKSNAKQHSQYLAKRLESWNAGKFDELVREGRDIQQKLRQTVRKDETPEHVAKVFARLIWAGKINPALRLLDKQESCGVAKLTDSTIEKLKELHPEAKAASENIMMTGELPHFDPVLFTNIDESSIAKAALRTRGAAGPSGMDADGWRRILISKNYGAAGKELRTAIAKLTQVLCTKEIALQNPNQTCLEAYIACRLIPLEKKPSGIRPIGIGEVLRRIIGKAIITEIKPDLAESAGCLQLCAGQKSGCEAAAHAMREIYEEEETDAILLIDASNAFNSLNREALLNNVQYLCPQLSTYVRNCYKVPSRLFVAGGVEITSSEGTTQGDPSAMPSYAVGILPFLSMIKPVDHPELMKHVAYADDLGGGSKLEKLREWWDKTEELGPSYGYYPKPEKSWLIVKETELERAAEIFHGTNINITIHGHKYLGGFIGTQAAIYEYVQSLVDDWMDQLDVLVSIAKSQPQAAYTAFTSGFKHRMTYFIRTIPNISEKLKPLDEKITNEFIPAISEGHQCTQAERSLLSLPVRMGGMAIPILSEMCDTEFQNSTLATNQLTRNIKQQIHAYDIDKDLEKEIELKIKKERKVKQEKTLEEVRKTMTKEEIRANDIAQLKGASAWLNALPLKDEGYDLNKREFFDAVQLRYRWNLKRLPLNCACKRSKFDQDHAMQCATGGFIKKRHDRIRDMLAKLLDDVAYDVRVEPPLQALTGEELPKSANSKEEARLDIAARGFWQDGAMAFFDVRVFNPFAKTHINSKIEANFKLNETQKKNDYNQRVIDIEHGSFTPIVMTAYGGFSRETEKFMSHLIVKIAEKKDVPLSCIANYVRTKVSFNLVKSQVLCMRGSRKIWSQNMDTHEAQVVQCKGEIRDSGV